MFKVKEAEREPSPPPTPNKPHTPAKSLEKKNDQKDSKIQRKINANACLQASVLFD